LAFALLIPAGCELLSDALSFTIYSDWETVTMDSAQLGLTFTGTVPPVPCSASADVCSAAASLQCTGTGYTCTLQCGGSGNCEIVASFDTSTSINISEEVTNETAASNLDKVTVQAVQYQVSENSFNFATPGMDIYVGPNTAAAIGDSGVTLLASIPAIAAGARPDATMNTTSSGQAKLEELAKNYKTPFKIFARATATYASGDPVPTGRMTISIRAGFKITPL
jgi:hypothetical protein